QREVRHALHGVNGGFHLAPIASVQRSQDEWLQSHRANLTGTITVLEEARRAQKELGQPVPIVYASSAAVYGNASEIAISEKTATVPTSAYGVDKLGSELHAAVASHSHNVGTIGLRFFNIYGPRQDSNSPYSGVISIFCQKILKGDTVE